MPFDKYEFFKECYYKELERKNQIVSSLSIPLGVITLIGGFLSYMLLNYNFFRNCRTNIADIIFILFSLFLFFILAYSLYCLLRSANGQPYRYIEDPSIINNYYKKVQKYYENKRDNFPEEKTQKDISVALGQSYMKATSSNWRCNLKKSSYRYKSHMAIIVSLTLFGLCSIIFIGTKLGCQYLECTENKITLRKGNNKLESKMTKNNDNNPRPNDTSEQDYDSDIDSLPVPPPELTVVIKEGDIPKKR